jgi:hypothetical protein
MQSHRVICRAKPRQCARTALWHHEIRRDRIEIERCPALDRDRRASRSATGRGNDPSIRSPVWERGWGCFEAPISVGDESAEAAGAKSLIRPMCRTRVRGPSRPCGGRLAEKVAGNVEKGEAPILLWERVEIRLDENLDGLFARINLDANRRVAKVDRVASPVLSSNDSVRHQRLARRRNLVDQYSGSETTPPRGLYARIPIGLSRRSPVSRESARLVPKTAS